jgi:hypothetical protein
MRDATEGEWVVGLSATYGRLVLSRLLLLSHSQTVVSASCSPEPRSCKAMSQQEQKPEDKESAVDVGPAVDPALGNSEVRGTIEASREALQKSAEEIERAKRLLRETEELKDIPSVSQPNDKAS